MTDNSNTVDAFINAIVDGLIKHEKFNEHIAGVVSKDGFTDDHLDEQIGLWMSDNFDLNDYGFNVEDYRYEIDGMIDGQVQHLAEDGELKEWLEIDGDATGRSFNERVFNALKEIDINFGMQIKYGHSIYTKSSKE